MKDIKVSILGHIQRGGTPSAQDRILASQLGLAALEGLLEGQKNVMVGIVNNEIVYTSFEDCISKTKELIEQYRKTAIGDIK